MSKEIRVLLDEDDFKKLVKGEVVRKGNVAIALEDIGFYKMGEAFGEAMKAAQDGT